MKGSPMERNFGISPMKQDKMKASQTKINAKTGVTTVDENPGSKKKKSKAIEMPFPQTLNPKRTVNMPSPSFEPNMDKPQKGSKNEKFMKK